MIVTHEQDKIGNPAFMLAPNTQVWRRAHMELAIPYFILTYQVAHRDGWISQTEMYWEANQLLHSCAQIAGDATLRLAQIALISPSWMNRQEGWQMDTVREIWRSSQSSGHPLTHYVTATGRRLMDAPDDMNGTPLIKLLAVEESGLFVAQQS